jgi:hypothetical protein
MKQSAISVTVSTVCEKRTLRKTVPNSRAPLDQFFPANQVDILCEPTFINNFEVFCIVKALPPSSGSRQGIKPNMTLENTKGAV